jgi:hypothetical protein
MSKHFIFSMIHFSNCTIHRDFIPHAHSPSSNPRRYPLAPDDHHRIVNVFHLEIHRTSLSLLFLLSPISALCLISVSSLSSLFSLLSFYQVVYQSSLYVLIAQSLPRSPPHCPACQHLFMFPSSIFPFLSTLLLNRS